MQKESITALQASSIITMFVIGSSLILGGSVEAGQDSWIALILGVFMVMPIILIYIRVIKLIPGVGLFEMPELLLGKIIGKVLTVLLTWYALHLGSLVLRNFQEFIEITALNQTPPIVISMMLILTVMYLAKSGVQTFAKWGVITVTVVISVVLFTVVFSLRHMDFSNILPIMDHKIGDISLNAFKLFSFPFAETVLFMSLAASIKRADSPYKIYILGVLVGAVVLLAAVFRNVLVLGVPMLQHEYFPSYVTARIIEIGDFITRIEGTISLNFILAGITKITVCLFAVSKGLASLINSQNYKNMVVPSGLLMLALASIVYKNIVEMVEFLKVYQIYAVPFQIIIPIAIWIAAEIKTKRGKIQLVP